VYSLSLLLDTVLFLNQNLGKQILDSLTIENHFRFIYGYFAKFMSKCYQQIALSRVKDINVFMTYGIGIKCS